MTEDAAKRPYSGFESKLLISTRWSTERDVTMTKIVNVEWG